ncbi:MAG: CHAT domain-containing protein, partial [Candidatus Aminicenantes bacterium]
KALNCYEQALTIPQYIKIKENQSACLNNIGIVYEKIGDYDKSLDYLMRALKINEELGNDVHIELNNIGESLRKKGLVSANEESLYEALEYLKDSLELTRKAGDKETEVYVLNNIGTVHSDLKKYREGLEYFEKGNEKAEEIQHIEMQGMLLNNMGIVHYNLGNYEESTRYFQRAIDIALEIEGKQVLWEAYLEIGKTYEKQGLLNKALENYKESIKTTENIRSQIKLEELRARYLGTNKRIEAYHNLIRLLIDLHRLNPRKGYDIEAFDYIERAKARAFLDSLELSQIDISQSVNPELLNREKELMKDITDIYNKLLAEELPRENKKDVENQLKNKENELEKLKREIRIKNPAYADVKYPDIITLYEAQKRLPDAKTAFFEYCIGEENSYALAITKKGVRIFPLPPKNEIQKKVKEYLEVISDKENENFRLGYELFSKLVLPGLDNNIKNIIFITDGILHFLPFEALLTNKEKREWLIKSYKVAYIPSISSLREILQHREANGADPQMDLLALGDPYFGPWETNNNGNDFIKDFYRNDTFQFFRLEFSALEIDKISSLFNKIKRNIFRREKATERQLKKHNLSDYKIIHLATHSLIDDRVPARSSIVLSLDKDSTEDGFLQMREIYKLKLNSDLVILSSCQTGLGRFLKGEGIEGLNRAFFYAGASSVIMTLWAVNDQASYQLIERFYDHLRSSQSIMNALRKAKLEMIESNILSHPYYWAGFIVTGNANKIIFPNKTKKWLFLGFSLLLIGGIILFSMRKYYSQRVSHD